MEMNAKLRKKTKLLNTKTTVLQSNYINLHLLLEFAKSRLSVEQEVAIHKDIIKR